MSYEHPAFVSGEIYHLYNRGVAKQPLFADESDYHRLRICFAHYVEAEPISDLATMLKTKRRATILTEPTEQPIVEIIAHCLMPNHFHLVVRQLVDGGISAFMRRSLNSYTRYYNTRHERIGTMFQGTFRAVLVTSDEQLLHLIRYVHLNPYVGKLIQTLDYQWSSHRDFLAGRTTRLAHPEPIMAMVGDQYRSFIEDYADYGRSLAIAKHLILEDE